MPALIVSVNAFSSSSLLLGRHSNFECLMLKNLVNRQDQTLTAPRKSMFSPRVCLVDSFIETPVALLQKSNTNVSVRAFTSRVFFAQFKILEQNTIKTVLICRVLPHPRPPALWSAGTLPTGARAWHGRAPSGPGCQGPRPPFGRRGTCGPRP
jgi:hypothetical protein